MNGSFKIYQVYIYSGARQAYFPVLRSIVSLIWSPLSMTTQRDHEAAVHLLFFCILPMFATSCPFLLPSLSLLTNKVMYEMLSNMNAAP